MDLDSGSLGPVYQEYLDTAVRAVGADQGYIATVNHETRIVQIILTHGQHEDYPFKTFSLSQGVAGHVATTARSYFVCNVDQDLYYSESHPAVQAEICSPLILGGNVELLLLLDSFSKSSFTKKSVYDVESVAADLAQELRRRIAHKPRRPQHTHKFTNLCESVIQEACEKTAADQAYIALVDDFDRMSIVCARTDGDPFLSLGSGRGFAGHVFKSQEPSVLLDVFSEDSKKCFGYIMSSSRVRQEAVAPIMLDGRAIGVVLVDSYGVSVFDDSTPSVLATAAERFVFEYERLGDDSDTAQAVNTANMARFIAVGDIPRYKDKAPLMFVQLDRRNASIVFTDLRGFTSLTNDLTGCPDLIGDFLTDYYRVAIDIVHNNGGILEKFIGDGMLAIFTPLESGDDCMKAVARDAVECCQQLQVAFDDVASRFVSQVSSRDGREIEAPKLGCIVHTGMCLLGFLNTPSRVDFTALGAQVNIAAKLENEFKHRPVRITKSTLACVEEWYQCSPLGSAEVDGTPYEVHEVIRRK